MSSQAPAGIGEDRSPAPGQELDGPIGPGGRVARPAAADNAALEVYTADLSRSLDVYRESVADRSAVLRDRERLLFLGAVSTAFAAPVLVVIGVILIVAGIATGGSLLTAAAILGGGASLALRKMQREAAAELKGIGKAQREDVRIAQSLYIAGQIPDAKERSRALREISGAVAVSGQVHAGPALRGSRRRGISRARKL